MTAPPALPPRRQRSPKFRLHHKHKGFKKRMVGWDKAIPTGVALIPEGAFPVFLTKAVLTQGIVRAMAEGHGFVDYYDDKLKAYITYCKTIRAWGRYRVAARGIWSAIFINEGVEWHLTLASATAFADKMRKRKIDLLQRQIAKLERMSWGLKEESNDQID